jgi:hypothetical protein
MRFDSDLVRDIRRYARANFTESELTESRKMVSNRRRHDQGRSHELTESQTATKETLIQKLLQEHHNNSPLTITRPDREPSGFKRPQPLYPAKLCS